MIKFSANGHETTTLLSDINHPVTNYCNKNYRIIIKANFWYQPPLLAKS